MKIVVIGGKGLIGSKVVSKLNSLGHDAVAASPSTGVDTISGKGLDEALEGAKVVVDVVNSPSFEEKAVLKFFETSTANIAKAELEAGVWHHVALSIVGMPKLPDNGYFKAKISQERLIEESHVPFTIVQSTQFFEFLGSIANTAGKDSSIPMPSGFFQPIASDDVAAFLVEYALGSPLNGAVEIAGPEPFRMADLVQKYLKATKDSRTVVSDPNATYFGSQLKDTTLLPGKKARIGKVNFENWMKSQIGQKSAV